MPNYVKVSGFGAYLIKILLLIGEVFVKQEEAFLFENDLSESPPLIRPKIGVNISMGMHNDLPRLRRLLPQWPARVLRNRFSGGDILFIPKLDNQIIHQIWISLKDRYVPLLSKRIVLKEGAAYRYHAYAAVEFRGKSIARAVRGRVLV